MAARMRACGDTFSAASLSFALSGLAGIAPLTQGLRPGLYSCAASRLDRPALQVEHSLSGSAFAKRLHRFLFAVEDFEHGQQLGDLQQIAHALGETQKL
jgi:hypothetical protein